MIGLILSDPRILETWARRGHERGKLGKITIFGWAEGAIFLDDNCVSARLFISLVLLYFNTMKSISFLTCTTLVHGKDSFLQSSLSDDVLMYASMDGRMSGPSLYIRYLERRCQPTAHSCMKLPSDSQSQQQQRRRCLLRILIVAVLKLYLGRVRRC